VNPPGTAQDATGSLAGPRNADEPHALALGDVVAGRYVVLGFLAAGGMGEVYRVFDEQLCEAVALKTIKGRSGADLGVRAQFRREVQLARKVTHPNVCRIFDLGWHRSLPFFTMELLAGRSLAVRLAETGRLTPAEALPIVAQVVAALDAVHARGLVHADVKPSNIVLVPWQDGMPPRAVLADLGLARAVAHAPSDLVGSPAYMAPEQVEAGRSLTPETDVYALGVVLYQMITGALPFVAETATATRQLRLLRAPVPPRDLVPGCDPAWDRVILRCLATDPAERFSTAGEVLRALQPPSRPSPSRWRARIWAPLGLAVVLGALAARVATRAPSSPVPARVRFAIAPFAGPEGGAAAYLRVALPQLLATSLRASPGVLVDVLAAPTWPGTTSGEHILRGRVSESGDPAAPILVDVEVLDGAGENAQLTAHEVASIEELPLLAGRTAARVLAPFGVPLVDDVGHAAARASWPGAAAAPSFFQGLSEQHAYRASAAIALLDHTVALAPAFAPAHAALAEALYEVGDVHGAFRHAKSAYDQAETLAPRARALVEGTFWQVHAEPARASAVYSRLLEDDPLDLEVHLLDLQASWRSGNAKELEAALARARGVAGVELEPVFDIAVKYDALVRGDYATVLRAAERLVQRGYALDSPGLVREGRISEAIYHWSAGNFAVSERAFRESVELARAAHDRNAVSGTEYFLGQLLLDRGRLGEAGASYAVGLAPEDDGRGQIPRALVGEARVALAGGDLAQAEKALAAAADRAQAAEDNSVVDADLDLLHALIDSERGFAGQARVRLRALLVSPSLSPVLRAYGWMAVADTEARLGATAAAEEAVRAALEAWRARGALFEVARTRSLWARVALLTGRTATTVAQARAALFLLEAMDASDERARAESVLAIGLARLGQLEEAEAHAARAVAAAKTSERLDVRVDVAYARALVEGDDAPLRAELVAARRQGALRPELDWLLLASAPRGH
jgi:tetratricopeptide (TPR) repeat protein